MKGDFSRSTFRSANHYSGVRLQQGRVLLDGTVADLLASDDPRVRRFRTGELGAEEGTGQRLQSYYRDLLL